MQKDQTDIPLPIMGLLPGRGEAAGLRHSLASIASEICPMPRREGYFAAVANTVYALSVASCARANSRSPSSSAPLPYHPHNSDTLYTPPGPVSPTHPTPPLRPTPYYHAVPPAYDTFAPDGTGTGYSGMGRLKSSTISHLPLHSLSSLLNISLLIGQCDAF
eukprot:GHVN01049822.1.p2 GENE.GHVN01049822.1~~GHVN01049822.1.p2  ORF type:complete len:162 (+),score=10.05 GHVN01049822.1:462-947(+)